MKRYYLKTKFIASLMALGLFVSSCKDKIQEELNTEQGQGMHAEDDWDAVGNVSLEGISLTFDDATLLQAVEEGYQFSRSAESLRSLKLSLTEATKNGEKRRNFLIDRTKLMDYIWLRLVVCDAGTREEVGTALVKFVKATQQASDPNKVKAIDPNTGLETTQDATEYLKPEKRAFYLKNKAGNHVELLQGKKYWASFRLDLKGRANTGTAAGPDEWMKPTEEYIANIGSMSRDIYIKSSLQDPTEAGTNHDQIVDIPYSSKWYPVIGTAKRTIDGEMGYRLAFKDGEMVSLSPLGSIVLVNITNNLKDKWIFLKGLELQNIKMLATIDNNVPANAEVTNAVYPKMKIKPSSTLSEHKVWLDRPFSLRNGKIWTYNTPSGSVGALGTGQGQYSSDGSFTHDKRATTLLMWVPCLDMPSGSTDRAEMNLSVLYGKFGPWRHEVKLSFTPMGAGQKQWAYASSQEFPSGRCFSAEVNFDPVTYTDGSGRLQESSLIERQLLPLEMLWYQATDMPVNTSGIPMGWGIGQESQRMDSGGTMYSGINVANASVIATHTGGTIPMVKSTRGVLSKGTSGPALYQNMHLPDLRDLFAIVPPSIAYTNEMVGSQGHIGISGFSGSDSSIPSSSDVLLHNVLGGSSYNGWSEFNVNPFNIHAGSSWATLFNYYRLFGENRGAALTNWDYRYVKEPVRLPYFKFRAVFNPINVPNTDEPPVPIRHSTPSAYIPDDNQYAQEMRTHCPADMNDAALIQNGKYVASKYMERTAISCYIAPDRSHSSSSVVNQKYSSVYGQRFLSTEWMSVWEYILPYGQGARAGTNKLEINAILVGNELDDEWYFRRKHPHWGGGTTSTYPDGWTTDPLALNRYTYHYNNSLMGDIKIMGRGTTGASNGTAEDIFSLYKLTQKNDEDNAYNLGEVVQRFIKVTHANITPTTTMSSIRHAYPYLIRKNGFTNNTGSTGHYYLWTFPPTWSSEYSEFEKSQQVLYNYADYSWNGLSLLMEFPNNDWNRDRPKGAVLLFSNLPVWKNEYIINH